MKSRLFFLWMVQGLVSLCWGGGLINLNNNFTPSGGTHKAFVMGQNGLPMPKALGRVEVLDSTGAIIRSGGFGADGLFFLGVTEIPGTVPGGSGSIILRIWDNSTGASYATAAIRQLTVVGLWNLGGGGAPPSSLATDSNFFGFPCLCPDTCYCDSGPVDPWALLDRLEWDGAIMTISGSSSPNSFWALEWSEDLRQWDPIGVVQQSGILQWVIPLPAADLGYFRIVHDP